MPVNLSEEELQLLAALPQSIGSAVAFAGRSGLFGTGKEMFASGQALMAGVKDYPGNELIQAIVPDPKAADKSAELEQARKTRDWAMARMKAKGITSAEADRADTGRRARGGAGARQQGRRHAGRSIPRMGAERGRRWPWRPRKAAFWALAARA